MKKRIVCLILLLGTLVLSLASCFRMPEPLPSDFVEGDEIVVDNNISFVYTPPSYEDYVPENAFTIAKRENYTYSYFQEWCGNKVIHCYKDDTVELYYTVYSLSNNSLFYLFLKPDGNGGFLMDQRFSVDARDHKDIWRIRVCEQDYPAVILEGKLPDYCFFDYYTAEEISRQTEYRWQYFIDDCTEAGLEPYSKLIFDRRDTIKSFYRCTQYVCFDLKETVDGRSLSWNGLYCYDLFFYQDGTAELHFQHYMHKNYWNYELLQDETVKLTEAEIEKLQGVIIDSDFENIPTWNPEEKRGFDGETTCILGVTPEYDHLISMWAPTPQYGIYQIRTAIEDLVREKIEVTSGRVYVDYEND